MILGKNKEKVVENIRHAASSGAFYQKVEVDDPSLTAEEKADILKRHRQRRRTCRYRIGNWMARVIIRAATSIENRHTRLTGLENIKGIEGGAIITSNHFSPLDNTVVRKAANAAWHQRIAVVSQETNLAMTGFVGFLMNDADIIPITGNARYNRRYFEPELASRLKKGEKILIYPEQEMWLNYRKPRPPKRGAYYYAAKCGVPVVSMFVEIREAKGLDTAQFRKIAYVMHILKPIYPNPEKSVRENSTEMMEADYRQKKEAYETAYGKKLTYVFEDGDVAGWIPKE